MRSSITTVDPGVALLSKPFTFAALGARVRRILPP
jgi:hypothetical protein